MREPTYPIVTERLLLRPLEPDDLDRLHAYHSLPEVVRYLYWPERSRADVRAMLERTTKVTSLRAESDALVLGMVLRDGGTLVGDVMLRWASAMHRQGEIGFITDPRHHGHGLAAEAATRLLRLGFEEHGLHRIFGRCDARNTASATLMARLGMRREAHLRENELVKGEWADELVFAMLDTEWRQRRSSA